MVTKFITPKRILRSINKFSYEFKDDNNKSRNNHFNNNFIVSIFLIEKRVYVLKVIIL